MVSTLDYIPGSSILGIFAAKYIRAKKLGGNAHLDAFFHNAFLNSGIIFTNAYINENDGGAIVAHYPTPISIQSLKIDGTKIFDQLNGESGEQVENIGNYCMIDGNEISKINVNKSINFHHARDDRLSGHSDEGTIFNYESIDPGQNFSGKIIGGKKDVEYLLSLFERFMKINIGRSRKIQYGHAELRIISEAPEIFTSEIDSLKAENLNNSFTLTLLSASILYNENGFPSTSLLDLKTYLAESLGVSSKDIYIENTFKKNETVENFVSKWLLKRPSEVSIKAGSCFKVKIDKFDENIKNSLVELQKRGLGERLGEGFGRFAINLQESKKYDIQGEVVQKIEKPSGEIPEITKNIIKNIVIESYQTSASVQALNDCREFCKYKDRIPTNSLLGKLELMLNDSNSGADFVEKINNMPDLSNSNLKRCRNKSENLFDFIKSGDDYILNIFRQNVYLEYYTLIDFDPETDYDLSFRTYTRYWKTFLASMRKDKKIGGD